jgi:hypothetical protein
MMLRSITYVSLVLFVGAMCVGCPLNPRLTVSALSHHFGVTNGTYETSWDFRVRNTGAQGEDLNFAVTTDQPWLSVNPEFGTTTGTNDPVTIVATIDRDYPNAKGISTDFLSATITVESNFGDELIAITVAPDYFTAEYNTTPDVENSSVTFRPNQSLSYYGACAESALLFPTLPIGGTVLDLSDTDPQAIALSTSISFYGNDYNLLYVSAYGYITFGASGNVTSTPDISLGEHFALPGITALSTVDATKTGTVSYRETNDRVAITFENVPNFNSQVAGTNDFQVEIFFNGDIRLTYLNLSAPDGVVGLSFGPTAALGGVPADFLESDFTAYPSCD